MLLLYAWPSGRRLATHLFHCHGHQSARVLTRIFMVFLAELSGHVVIASCRRLGVEATVTQRPQQPRPEPGPKLLSAKLIWLKASVSQI
jgi:hypothetical protein